MPPNTLRLSHAVVIALTCSLVQSCAHSKLPITNLADADLDNRVYYLDRDNDEIHSYHLHSGKSVEILAHSFIREVLWDPGHSASLSPFGRYGAIQNRKMRNPLDAFHKDKKLFFSVYDSKKREFVQDVKAFAPLLEYNNESLFVPWSAIDESFYIIRSDSTLKCRPAGDCQVLAIFKSPLEFSVSPSEKRILAYFDGKIGVYLAETHETREIAKFKRLLGMGRRFIRGISWSPDESKVSFAENWDLYIYDAAKDSLTKWKARNKVFDTLWINDEEIVYVSGSYPSDMSRLDQTQSFSINRLDTRTLSSQKIYYRINHEPLSIKPKLSPSGDFLLFSERPLNDHYRVSLLSLDGKRIRRLTKGMYPIWGKEGRE